MADSAPGDIDYQRLFESMPTPYLVLDTGLVVVAVNDAYLAATMNSRDSLLGKHIFEAFPDNPANPAADGVRNLRQSLRAVLTTGRPDAMTLQRYDIPADPAQPDGEFVERYWSPVNTPVFAEDGSVVNIIHRVEDVTEFVRMRQLGQQRQRAVEAAEARSERMETDLFARAREVQDVNHQLREANEQLAAVSATLRQQQEAKDRFIATLSHELRNPLAAAQVAVELLAEQTDAGHPAVGVLQRQLDALVRMTDDLLDATRAMTGRLAVERQVIDLRDVVTAALADVERALRESGRELRVTLPDVGVLVFGDRIRLGQMLGNLLGNARKYTRYGCAIDVELAVAGDTATLTVRDDGIGFDPAIAEQLFEVFARAEPKAGTDVGGLGVGLAIVRGVVELHGGTVTAHSDGEGTGASFVATLPLATGESWHEPGESVTNPAAGASHPPRRVLLIEDNTDLAATYQMLLEQRGDTVTVAGTGTRGLELAFSQPFDLVLSDIGLPDVDGWEVARRLRELPERARMLVVAVSGFGQESDRERSRQAGFDAHIAKPMRLSDLDAVWAGVARPS